MLTSEVGGYDGLGLGVTEGCSISKHQRVKVRMGQTRM
jgi:hypothetical protein